MKIFLILACVLVCLIFQTISVLMILIMKKGCATLKFAPDFLMILGCKVNGDEASRTLMTRIEKAAEYLIANDDTIAICCGGLVQKEQTKSEAQVIYDHLCQRGIDKSRLILEDKSKTTAENFINSKKILDSMNLKKEYTLGFLSSDFHIFRAEILSQRCGIACTGMGAISKDKRIKNHLREIFVLPLVFLKSETSDK